LSQSKRSTGRVVMVLVTRLPFLLNRKG